MKVLMFGWEFPPHISGGLGTACYGLVKGMDHHKQDLIFVVPKLWGDEDPLAEFVNASEIEIDYRERRFRDIWKNLTYLEVSSFLVPYLSPEEYHNHTERLLKDQDELESSVLANKFSFSGKYGKDLILEVSRYALVAAQIAKNKKFDLIHAHDWLSFPAGIAAKQISGKPMIAHVHATEFDRSGQTVNQRVFDIEKAGMEAADKIIAVSQLTKNTIVTKYGIPEEKVTVVHNAVLDTSIIKSHVEKKVPEKIVTFLGRITFQKGPEYFVEAAAKVIKKDENVRFVMAGSGDLLNRMIQRVAELRIGTKFHFTGFLKGDDVDKMFALSDVYVMPSVSEPFGISPLEAVRHNTPVIISKQSGVAEVLQNAVKVDFWDIDAMADAIFALLHYNGISKMFKEMGREELKRLKWEHVAEKVIGIYKQTVNQQDMRTICFYFQVHQPFRLKPYRFFEIGDDHDYWDDYSNRNIMNKVAKKCYLPMNQLLLELIRKFDGKFKVCFSLSGTVLDQMEAYAPEVLHSFQELVATGHVELLNETYGHSLCALKSETEFKDMVKLHQEKIQHHFNGYKPKVFRNTELIYSDEIGAMVAKMGFEGILSEGAKHILGWKSPNFVYVNSIEPKLKVLLKNFRLSDDIAFRFGEKTWTDYPLTTDKFIGWLNQVPQEDEVINLFMDYETFGEHQWKETGIFEFMKDLPGAIFQQTNFSFSTPSEVIANASPVGQINVPTPISWADEERDLTAWLGNDLQDEAFDRLFELESMVKRCDDPEIYKDWRYLQTSDHFYYMCTKFFSDGDIHAYFSPYESPYEAFINYMNVLSDFILRLKQAEKAKA